MDKPYIPSSVYRLQFNQHFTFNDAIERINYLKKLGIDAVYTKGLNYRKSYPELFLEGDHTPLRVEGPGKGAYHCVYAFLQGYEGHIRCCALVI